MVEGTIGAVGAATITLEGVELACRAMAVVVSSQMGDTLRAQRGLMDERQQPRTVFAPNLWEVVDRSSVQKKEEKRAERARNVIANPSCYSPSWASYFTGRPFVFSPHPAEKGRPTSLIRGEGLAAAIPG